MDNTKVRCQLYGCVSNHENYDLIGISRISNFDFESAICKDCARVLGIKHGDKMPKNAKELLDQYHAVNA